MRYNTNDIDKKLRQLETQSLPDLSMMDEHWLQMKANMIPDASLVKPGRSRKIYSRWIIAACLIGLLFFIGYKLLLPATQKKNITRENPAPVKPLSDTIRVPSVEMEQQSNPVSRDQQNIVHHLKDNGQPVKSLPEPVIADDISDGPPPVANNIATLADFFKEIEKASQQFVIDNKKDTVIHGMDGSALAIPANTFKSNGPVTIVLKEYYSYEDIISNRLATMSDNKQLITGGMLHITAIADGKELNIDSGKAIRWFIPDTSAEMKQMQLFTGEMQSIETNNNTTVRFPYRDSPRRDSFAITTIYANSQFSNSINWIPNNTNFDNNAGNTMVKVLDLRNEPLRSRNTSKGKIGVFKIDNKSNLSEEELQAELKEKYGYYKVKLKRVRMGGLRIGRIRFRDISDQDVGDSTWMTLNNAQTYKLVATDTFVYVYSSAMVINTANLRLGSLFNGDSLNKLAKRYSVDISKLGWINCDRFYKDNRPLVNYAVNLRDTAANYFTMLVFDEMKSMMTGYIQGNRVMFSNVPAGLKATVFCVGIKNGKAVAAKESVEVSSAMFDNLRFEETTPGDFKQEVATLDQ